MADDDKSSSFMKLLWILVSAIIGAAASYMVPQWIDEVTLSNAPVATGEWLSEWRWDKEPKGEWHKEHVQMEHSLGRLKIWCIYSPDGNQWEAVGRLVEKVRGTHIVGGWHSTKPGALASGPFALSTLASHGESMYGYFGDYDDHNGNAVIGTWLLAKDSTHLRDAEEWMRLNREPHKGN